MVFGFTTRDKRYKEYLDNHPLVNWSEIQDFWKVPVHKWLYETIKKYNIKEEDRTTFWKDLIGSVLDGYQVRFKESYKNLPFKLYPGLRTELAFAEGATNIDRVYTIEHTVNGVVYEFPVFLRAAPEGETPKGPEDEELQRNIDRVKKYNQSEYDKMGTQESHYSTEAYINEDFIKFGVEKFTRTDYSGFFEQEKTVIHRWFIKDETWIIQQYGERDTEMENSLPQQFQNQGVKIYKKPVQKSGFFYELGSSFLFYDKTSRSGTMWWYWKVGDWIYDFIDTIFDTVQELLLRTGVPEEGIRAVARSEYKSIARGRRGFFNPRRPSLTFRAVARSEYESVARGVMSFFKTGGPSLTYCAAA